MNDSLYQQDTELEILSLLIPYIENRVFLDIGAEKGSFARFMLESGFSGILFEPCPKHQGALGEMCTDHPLRFYPYAIDSDNREADFFINLDENDEPSDYYHSLHCLQNDPKVNHRDRIRVECRTLASLLGEGVVPESPGLVKIDTEGNDLQVVRGMGGMVPEVVICEFLTPGLYSGWESAAPEGLIREAEGLGLGHYIAVKRWADQELISMGPAAFIDRQWGNLIFFNERIYRSVFEPLKKAVAESETRLFSLPREALEQKDLEIQKLQSVCNERLELIDYLHHEAEKRLEIIEQLKENAGHPEKPEQKDG